MEAAARITRSLAQQAPGRIRGLTQEPAMAAVDLTQSCDRGHFGVAMDLVSGPLPPGSPRQVSKSRFKAQALELFHQVESSGEPLVVTDHGRPTGAAPLSAATAVPPPAQTSQAAHWLWRRHAPPSPGARPQTGNLSTARLQAWGRAEPRAPGACLIRFLSLRLKPKAAAAPNSGRGPGAAVGAGAV